MLDKVIEKMLDLFIDYEFLERLEKIPMLKSFCIILKDRLFMIHIVKYLIVGVITTLFSIGSFWILINSTTLNENLSNFISIVIGILSAYIMNRCYVFESKEKNIVKEFSKFVLARVASSIFDMISFFVFATCFKLNEMLVKIVISIVVIILNYFLSKLIVFKHNKEGMS